MATTKPKPKQPKSVQCRYTLALHTAKQAGYSVRVRNDGSWIWLNPGGRDNNTDMCFASPSLAWLDLFSKIDPYDIISQQVEVWRQGSRQPATMKIPHIKK